MKAPSRMQKAKSSAVSMPGGTAIIPYESPHRDRLIAAAMPYAGEIVTFGRDPRADIHAREGLAGPRGTFVQARNCAAAELTFTVGPPGEHWVTNALAVLAVVEAAGGDLASAGLALADHGGFAWARAAHHDPTCPTAMPC